MPSNSAERVAFFLPTLEVGGVERVVVQLAEAIADTGRQVDLVVAEAGDRVGIATPAAVNSVNLRVSRTFSAVIPLMRYLRRDRPTALISAKDHANVVAVAASHLARTGTPVIASVHSRPSDALREPERWTGRVVRRLLPFAYDHAAAIVAVSPGVAEDLREILPRSKTTISVITNPVVSPTLLRARDASPPHEWLAIGRPEPVVVWCGRLSDEKDPVAALDALALLRTSRLVRLLIVGDGPLRSAVERRAAELGIADAVRITGFLGDPGPYLRHADVVALTSRREGLPTVLIEALALGTAVVSTDCPVGPRDILAAGAYGRLVPVADPDALARALGAALDTPLADAPPEALAAYDVKQSAAHYVALLEKVRTR